MKDQAMYSNANNTNEVLINIEDRPNDGYPELLEHIRKSFNEEVADIKEPLFITDAYKKNDLYEMFLNNLPVEARQHYNCRACRNFVNRYGSIVRVDEDGNIRPVMWNYTPKFFNHAICDIRNAVLLSKIESVFIPSEKRLGTPKTGVWHHMAVDIPRDRIYHGRLKNAHQTMAEMNEEFKMLMTAARTYNVETVKTAITLLKSDAMYRGDKILPHAEWFLDILNIKRGDRKFTNLIWKKAVTAPTGFCHITSGMLGSLMDDIANGYHVDVIIRKFNEKMDPLCYQRPQAAPSAGNVARAEKIVAELGIENSLKRRFARIDEIETVWNPVLSNTLGSSATTGVFAGIKTKEDMSKRNDTICAPETTMTLEKFRRTVLPEAKKIELLVPSARNSYAAIVTAEDSDAPPIILWDSEEQRNPFSWYIYNNGSYPSAWNLPDNKFVEVIGISLQPNLWQSGFEQLGKGVIFILKDCKDLYNKSSGLFPEVLRGELREVRSTIEAYSREHCLSGWDEASACGLMLQSSSEDWICKLRVTTDNGVSLYKLDRWD